MDIPLRPDLDRLVQQSNGRVRVAHGVDEADEKWNGYTGLVSEKMIKDTMFSPSEKDSVLIVCGPPGMMKHVCGERGSRGEQGPIRGVLKEMGYERVYKL